MTPREVKARINQIRNLCDTIAVSLQNDVDGWVQEMLADLLRRSWELARDVNPDIIIRASTAITPPKPRGIKL
jgi:hypothetical protein